MGNVMTNEAQNTTKKKKKHRPILNCVFCGEKCKSEMKQYALCKKCMHMNDGVELCKKWFVNLESVDYTKVREPQQFECKHGRKMTGTIRGFIKHAKQSEECPHKNKEKFKVKKKKKKEDIDHAILIEICTKYLTNSGDLNYSNLELDQTFICKHNRMILGTLYDIYKCKSTKKCPHRSKDILTVLEDEVAKQNKKKKKKDFSKGLDAGYTYNTYNQAIPPSLSPSVPAYPSTYGTYSSLPPVRTSSYTLPPVPQIKVPAIPPPPSSNYSYQPSVNYPQQSYRQAPPTLRTVTQPTVPTYVPSVPIYTPPPVVQPPAPVIQQIPTPTLNPPAFTPPPPTFDEECPKIPTIPPPPTMQLKESEPLIDLLSPGKAEENPSTLFDIQM